VRSDWERGRPRLQRESQRKAKARPSLERQVAAYPYRFDVKPFACIRLQDLRDHIERVGIPLYPEPGNRLDRIETKF